MNKLFRAKNLEDEWVFGYYSSEHSIWYDLNRIVHSIGNTSEFEEIKPETLSMWTGVSDKDGTPIYGSVPHIVEGSIGGDCIGNGDERNYRDTYHIGRVYFKDGVFIFENGYGLEPMSNMALDKIKIIGNLIDNPELGE
jgi:hypothetical protein